MSTASKHLFGALLVAIIGAGCSSPSAPSSPPANADAEKDTAPRSKTKKSKSKDSDSEDAIATDDAESSSDKSTSKSEEPEDPFLSLLHTEKLKSCHAEGLLYDRRTASDSSEGSCHTAKYPSKFECTKAGITGAFNNSSTIRSYLTTQESDGYEIDQCGQTTAGNPIVFFIKKDLAEGVASLKIRVAEPK